jgi:predicted  nucleic acid-binding Zn-ribbon protein
MDLQDEMVRTKRNLDDKNYEASRMQDDNAKKSDSNLDLRDQATDLDKEIDMLKSNRADN